MDGGSHNLFTKRRLKLFKKVLDNKRRKAYYRISLFIQQTNYLHNSVRKYKRIVVN